MFGEKTAVAVLPGSDEIAVVARSRGADPDRGIRAIRDAVAFFDGGDAADYPLDGFLEEYRSGLVLGTTPEALDAVRKGGALGEQERFRGAVPDPEAPFVLYVDLRTVLEDFDREPDLDLTASERRAVAPIEALGFSSDDDRFTLRPGSASGLPSCHAATGHGPGRVDGPLLGRLRAARDAQPDALRCCRSPR